MSTRAERRRENRDKQERPTEAESYRELSQREMEEAEAELRSETTWLESNAATRWAALLDKWFRFDSQREAAKADYDLRAELPQGTTRQSVESYAEAKRALLGIEREMVRILLERKKEERDELLRNRFMYHALTFSRPVAVDDILRERLQEALQGTAKEEETDGSSGSA